MEGQIKKKSNNQKKQNLKGSKRNIVDKKFATVIIKLYERFGPELDEKDLAKHSQVLGIMQEIRDRKTKKIVKTIYEQKVG